MHVQRMYNSATYFQLRDGTGSEPLTRDPTRFDPDAFFDPVTLPGLWVYIELSDYFYDGVLQVNAFCQKSLVYAAHTDH